MPICSRSSFWKKNWQSRSESLATRLVPWQRSHLFNSPLLFVIPSEAEGSAVSFFAFCWAFLGLGHLQIGDRTFRIMGEAKSVDAISGLELARTYEC
jgi:hypothetical protein